MKFKNSPWIHICLWGSMILYLIVSPLVEARFFVHQGKPLQVAGALPAATDLVYYGVDASTPVVFQREKLTRVNGWSFLSTAADLADYNVYLVLTSPHHQYFYLTTPAGRRDIPRVYAAFDLDLSNSGFTVFIAKEAIRVDKYEIGLLYQHLESGERTYQETGRVLTRTPNTLTLVPLETTP